MRLKVYQAPNIGAAMAMVRSELGPDALILGSRELDGGFEVTAAKENQPATPSAVPDPSRQACLRWHGIPGPIAAKLAAHDLAAAIRTNLGFAPLQCSTAGAPLLIVGLPGAGKTLTTARLATRLVLAGGKPHVVTADGKRAGAAEQLAAFTRLLGLTLIAADTPVALARAVARRPVGAPVLIDTPGLNPADPDEATHLQELQAATGGVMALVMPAELDPAEAEEIADGFKGLGATLLIPTRLDQARRLGGVVAAAAAGLALTEAGVGPGVADGLRPLTPEGLAERLAARGAGGERKRPAL